MRILVAEDDSVSRALMQKFMEKYGECDVAVDGLETIYKFDLALEQDNPYELVLLDIMMPKIDGIKALKRINELEDQYDIAKDNRAKVIMTSALNDSKTVRESYDAGCTDYLWKPVDLKKLKEIMKRSDL